jgi:hypothetical protein
LILRDSLELSGQLHARPNKRQLPPAAAAIRAARLSPTQALWAV